MSSLSCLSMTPFGRTFSPRCSWLGLKRKRIDEPRTDAKKRILGEVPTPKDLLQVGPFEVSVEDVRRNFRSRSLHDTGAIINYAVQQALDASLPFASLELIALIASYCMPQAPRWHYLHVNPSDRVPVVLRTVFTTREREEFELRVTSESPERPGERDVHHPGQFKPFRGGF